MDTIALWEEEIAESRRHSFEKLDNKIDFLTESFEMDIQYSEMFGITESVLSTIKEKFLQALEAIKKFFQMIGNKIMELIKKAKTKFLELKAKFKKKKAEESGEETSSEEPEKAPTYEAPKAEETKKEEPAKTEAPKAAPATSTKTAAQKNETKKPAPAKEYKPANVQQAAPQKKEEKKVEAPKPAPAPAKPEKSEEEIIKEKLEDLVSKQSPIYSYRMNNIGDQIKRDGNDALELSMGDMTQKDLDDIHAVIENEEDLSNNLFNNVDILDRHLLTPKNGDFFLNEYDKCIVYLEGKKKVMDEFAGYATEMAGYVKEEKAKESEDNKTIIGIFSGALKVFTLCKSNLGKIVKENFKTQMAIEKYLDILTA